MNQAGFTKNKSTRDHLVRLWQAIDKTKKDGINLNIASIDIKGAYDGVDHEVLLKQLEYWKKVGFYNQQVLDMIKFLFSQYKIGLIEAKGHDFKKVCLINVGVPQGSRLSCNIFNGV